MIALVIGMTQYSSAPMPRSAAPLDGREHSTDPGCEPLKSYSGVDFILSLDYKAGVARTALPTPPRARRSDFQRTRERIVAAARREIGERGPESLTVSGVAHAAGINRTTAYQHFRTRDELVHAVSEELVAELRAFLASQRPMVEHIDAIAGYFLDHPEVARLALYWLLTDSPAPRAGIELFRQEMRAAVEEEG